MAQPSKLITTINKLITTLKKSTYSRKRFHYFTYTTHRIPMKKTMDYHAQLIVFHLLSTEPFTAQ